MISVSIKQVDEIGQARSQARVVYVIMWVPPRSRKR